MSFLSKCWGERISDKEIIVYSRLHDFLDPGDMVMASCGLDMENKFTAKQRFLNVLPHRYSKVYLRAHDIDKIRCVAELSIPAYMHGILLF